MIHFNDLKFILCKNGNSLAELILDNYNLDIVKKPKTKNYKVKPFELGFGKKRYLADVFPEYGDFPEFAGRELLLVFLNQVDKHNLSDVSTELDEEVDEKGEEA